MNKYTIKQSQNITLLLDDVCAKMAEQIKELNFKAEYCILLGGGYGRGEGGILVKNDNEYLYNDLDFFVFFDNATKAELTYSNIELEKIATKWHGELGIDVDFAPAKNVRNIKKQQYTLMYQELIRGYKNIVGNLDIEKFIQKINVDEIGKFEAMRLLVNRGMGLLFAAEKIQQKSNDKDFILRNCNKAILGCYDALLIVNNEYKWSINDRANANSSSYAKAVEFKAMPNLSLSQEDIVEKFNLTKVEFLEISKEVVKFISKNELNFSGLKQLLRWVKSCPQLAPKNVDIFKEPLLVIYPKIMELINLGLDNNFSVDEFRRIVKVWRYFN